MMWFTIDFSGQVKWNGGACGEQGHPVVEHRRPRLSEGSPPQAPMENDAEQDMLEDMFMPGKTEGL